MRARCKNGTCAVDFGRAPAPKRRAVVRAAEHLGLKFVAGAMDVEGPDTYASQMIMEDRRGGAK